MNFDQKLNALVNLFKISNSSLSRGIGVDASLISRWKSGERKISKNSPHIPKLASYFLHRSAYHYQKEYLEKIIAVRLPENERQDDASRIHVLADWLISSEPPEPQPNEQPEQLAQSVSLISNISGLLSSNQQNHKKTAEQVAADKSSAMQAEEWQPLIRSGQQSTYELFEGRAGKRQAVLNLLYQVLQSDTKLELLLTSEDSTNWMTEDRSFTVLWARLLRQVIEQGHKITLIHVVNRRINELMNMLDYWMPLHMAGRMNSYYYPRFGDRRVRQTLFIIKGQAAIVSTTIADSEADEPTFVFTDPVTIAQYTRVFMVHLGQCRPLFAVYSRENMQDFFDQSLEYSKKPGAVYNIRHQLNFRLMPLKIVESCVIKSQGHANGQMMNNWLNPMRQTFLDRLACDHYVDILPISLLDRIQSQMHSYLACCEIFSEKPITVSLKETIAWLQETVNALRRHENYEIFLYPENMAFESMQINVTYKESNVALFSPSARDFKTASIIMLSENNILHSMSYYFDDFIQQIPTSMRSKPEVIQRLEKTISNLNALAAAKGNQD